MRTPVLLLLFFSSGACALAYEVVWIRLLGLTLSVTVYALTTVLCAFMGGLALGAALASRFADRTRRPLAAFGLVELGIAVCGLTVPSVLFGLGPAYVWIHEAFGGESLGFLMLRFLLAFAVLMVPTTLMGTTLPLLSRTVIGSGDAVGRGAGALYAANTLGAVVGCVVAGFVAIAHLGLYGTSAAAAAVNVSIGVLAVALGRRPLPRLEAAAAAERPGRLPFAAVLASLAFAVSGFTAMGYEVLWTRSLEHFTHNSTYAYTAMLATFLAGIGLGSAAAARMADRLRSPLFALGVAQMAIGASVIVALVLFMQFERWAPGWVEAMGGLSSWPRAVALIFGEAALTLLVTTLFFGATFPLVARAVVESVRHVGNRIALAYTANTLGSILGALLVGFFVLPELGVRGSFVALLAANLAVGSVLVLVASPRGAGGALAVGAAGLALGAHVLLPQNLLEAQFARRFGELLFYREEVTDTVMVTQAPDGSRMIRFGDGRGTAGTATVVEDRMYAHVPMLLHPQPRRILQITFGVGNSLSSVLRHPVERVDCVELSPGVTAAAPFFRATNRDVLDDPRVDLIIDDGRNFLLASRERYDVIRLDPPELHTAGVVSLYTREFYQMARDHLAPGGIFSIWVNAAMTPEDDLRLLVRTLSTVFPFVSVWHGPAYYSWVMNGSVEPHDPDFAVLERHFADERVAADLATIGMHDPYDFLAHFLFANEGARAFAGEGPIVSDDHTRLDFSVPRSGDSYFGIANWNTDHWLVRMRGAQEGSLDPVDARFLRKIVSLGRFRRPVAPHVANAQAGGGRAEIARRVEQARGRAPGPGPQGASRPDPARKSATTSATARLPGSDR